MNAVKFDGWERDTDIAEHAWTNYCMAGDGPEDDYDMVIIGEPDQ
jgi:hypothetical protein